MLNRDSILTAQDLKTIDVDVPEWGGSIRLRTMTGNDRQEYFKNLAEEKGIKKNFMAALLVACAVDEQGNSIFTAKDIPKLSEKSGIALNNIFEQAAELNGLTQKSVDTIAGE